MSTQTEAKAELARRSELLLADARFRAGQPARDARDHMIVGSHPWPPAIEGTRHDAIVSAAGYCAARGYPLHHALLVIREWNSHNLPPETDATVREQVSDIYVRYAQDPRGGGEYVPLSRHRSAKLPPRRWLIPGFLPAGQRMALLGRWGCGKSLLALDAAHAVAHGTRFLGEIEPATRGNVVILDGEGGKLRAIERYNALRLALNLPEAPDPDGAPDIYWHAAAGLNLSSTPAIERLRDEMRERQPVLIIFDTLAKVLGMTDENSNGGASRITQSLYALNQDLGATLLLIAHPAKGDGSSQTVRGAGELSADLDVMWSITTPQLEPRRARCQKDRDGDLESARLDFEIEQQNGGTMPRLAESDSDSSAAYADIEAAIMSALGDGNLKGGELVKTVLASEDTSRTQVYRLLRAMADAGKIISAGGTWSVRRDGADQTA